MDLKQIYREETKIEPYSGLKIENNFTLHYVKWLEAKICHKQCCTELPTKEEMFDENGRKVFEIENSNKIFSKHTPYLLGFSSGFQKCYEWLTK